MRWVRVLLLVAVWPSSPLQAQDSPPPQVDPNSELRITKLLGQMTLEEKIGQLVHFADSSTGPGAPHPDYREPG